MHIVQELRKKGWLDWHILTALSTVVVNWRIQQEHSTECEPFRLRQLMNMYMQESEKIDSGYLESEISVKRLELSRQMNMLSSLKVWDLEIHQITPDFKAVEQFLDERYNYWTDDVEHEDPFRFLRQ